jgi:anthranilate/para-aminobenzoate synthase component II
MERQTDKIIIDRKTDREIYNLVDKLESTGFGTMKFRGKEVKEIQIREKKPSMIVVEESIRLD